MRQFLTGAANHFDFSGIRRYGTLDTVFSWCEGLIPLRGFVDKGQGRDGKPSGRQAPQRNDTDCLEAGPLRDNPLIRLEWVMLTNCGAKDGLP
jgi:hypothetical protein